MKSFRIIAVVSFRVIGIVLASNKNSTSIALVSVE